MLRLLREVLFGGARRRPGRSTLRHQACSILVLAFPLAVRREALLLEKRLLLGIGSAAIGRTDRRVGAAGNMLCFV